MVSVLDRYERISHRHRRRARQAHKRLDIQGLRMVAVLTVFANLWGWPSGGYIGVDVFFVISGFLITGNLMRMAETDGNVSFTAFYWNRVRRIVPAATGHPGNNLRGRCADLPAVPGERSRDGRVLRVHLYV